jgi:hypothetical protein
MNGRKSNLVKRTARRKETDKTMLNRSTRFLLAALEAIIGWEWLMSGGNKLLAGTFPQGLADALKRGIKNNPNSWYVSMLQTFVLPHSIFYGYLVEWYTTPSTSC